MQGSQKHMLNHCDNCPEQFVIKDFLMVQLLKKYDTGSSISFKQWVSTDLTQLVEKESDVDEFIDSITTMFIEVNEHRYIAKKQIQFFKQGKASLKSDKCIHVLDFAENNLSIVQDAAQGFHRNNSQATIHSFMLYYMDENTKFSTRYMLV